MSYEKCKYISLDRKHNKIKVTIASNNVYPLDWCKCEIYNRDKDQGLSFDDKLLLFYVDLEEGNIQVSAINKSTLDVEYAMCKVREYHQENNIDSYEDLYKGCGRLYEQDKSRSWIEIYKEIYGKSFEIFKNALAEKIEGNYKVIAYGCYNVSKLGKYDRCYHRFYYGGSPAIMSYKQAYIFKHDMDKCKNSNDKFEIQKV